MTSVSTSRRPYWVRALKFFAAILAALLALPYLLTPLYLFG